MDSENNQPTPAPASTAIPVMDIQAPKPTNPTANPVSTESMIGGPAVEPGAVAPAPISEALSGTEPVTEAPVTPVAANDTPTSVPPTGPDAEIGGEPGFSPAVPEATPPPAAKAPKKHHSAPVAAVIVAIIIALGLVGVAVFAYMKSHDQKKSPTTAATTTTSTSQTSNSVSTQDVDSSSSNIDSNLKKIDEAKDFPATDLSDSSLSLQ